jgi:hypothetical protein
MTLLLASHARSQTSRIDEKPACRCSIKVQKHATLELGTQGGSFFPSIRVTRTTRGEYLAGPSSDRRRYAVFSARGHFIKWIGARDGAVVEFATLYPLLVWAKDSVLAFDRTRKQAAILSSSLQHVRTVSLPARVEEALIVGGAIVAVASVPTPDLFGKPLHVIELADGRIRNSFGKPDGPLLPGATTQLFRLLAAAASKEFWAARVDRLEIEKWSVSGTLVRRIVRAPDWYPPWPGARPPAESIQRPWPQLRDLRQAADGRLWLVSTVSRDDWAVDSEFVRAKTREAPIVEGRHLSRYLDTMVELIDTHNGRVYASTRLTGAYLGFAGDGLLFSRRPSGRDSELIDIWEVSLSR